MGARGKRPKAFSKRLWKTLRLPLLTNSQPIPNVNLTTRARISCVFHNRGSVHRPHFRNSAARGFKKIGRSHAVSTHRFCGRPYYSYADPKLSRFSTSSNRMSFRSGSRKESIFESGTEPDRWVTAV